MRTIICLVQDKVVPQVFQKLHLNKGGMPRKMFDQAAVTRCIQCIASQMDTLKARFLPIK